MTKTFLLSHRDQRHPYQREDIGNMIPICISGDLLNMCSESKVAGNKDMHKSLKGIDFGHIQRIRVVSPPNHFLP